MAVNGSSLGFFGNSLKEDVLPIIYQITPTDTPAFSMCGDGKATSAIHEVLQRNISVNQDNAVLEGAAFANDAAQFPTRNKNLCQIFRRQPSVTGTAQSLGLYGIDDPYLDQMEQAMAGFKTDMNLAFVKGSNGTSITLTTDMTRRMDGIIYWLSRSNYWSRSTDATMTEQGLNDIGQTLWENGVEPSDILVGAVFKRRIAGFAGWPDTGFGQIVSRDRAADDPKLFAQVDVYKTDFIDARVFKERNLNADASWQNAKFLVMFDRSLFRKAWLRTPFSAKRPYTADTDDGLIMSEFTCEGSHVVSGGWLQAQ